MVPIPAEKWIANLLTKWSEVRKRHGEVIDSLGQEFGTVPDELLKFYVEPMCQHLNPADNPSEEVTSQVRGHTMDTISNFTRARLTGEGPHTMFVFSDAGMGKTSLLLMLRLAHLNAFWPSEISCELMKIGPDTIERMKSIKGCARTILLLDSLDEDAAAWQQCRNRMLELLAAAKNFYRVIITCRTQFFPADGTDIIEAPGYVVVGGYRCQSIYLSPFDDNQIATYLRRRFPRTFFQRLLGQDNLAHSRAKKLVTSEFMGTLRMRPLLLAYVDDLIRSDSDTPNKYVIFERLVDEWLRRECRKMPALVPNDLGAAAEALAIAMEKETSYLVSSETLNNISKTAPTTLDGLKIGTRSLINRTADGRFRFSHRAISEFLLARLIADGRLPAAWSGRPTVRGSDELGSFLSLYRGVVNPRIANMTMVRATFRRLRFENWRFEDIDFTSGSDFEATDFVTCTFDGCKLAGAFFGSIRGQNLSFHRCDLRAASFSKAVLDHVRFTSCDVRDTVFSDASRGDLEFEDCQGNPGSRSGELSVKAEV